MWQWVGYYNAMSLVLTEETYGVIDEAVVRFSWTILFVKNSIVCTEEERPEKQFRFAIFSCHWHREAVLASLA